MDRRNVRREDGTSRPCPAVTSGIEDLAVKARKRASKISDTVRDRATDKSVLLDKAPASEADDPFAAFSEWSGEADEKAYGGL
jgi:hypothetical protein